MPELTRRRNLNALAECWHAFSGGVRVDAIALRTDDPDHEDHPRDAFLARWPSSNARPPKAANDNGLAWPFIPFPYGWYAACLTQPGRWEGGNLMPGQGLTYKV